MSKRRRRKIKPMKPISCPKERTKRKTTILRNQKRIHQTSLRHLLNPINLQEVKVPHLHPL